MDRNQGNKLIADFMEYAFDYPVDRLRYDKSWDSLMPVVDKIGKLMIPKEKLNSGWSLDVSYAITRIGTYFTIGDNFLHITDGGRNPKTWDNASKMSTIERTWTAVIEFITWYNE